VGVVAAALLSSSASAASGPPRSVLRCRRQIAHTFAFMIDAGLSSLASCHVARKPAGDCNVIAGSIDFERAAQRAHSIISAFCTANDPVLDNFPIVGGDIVQPTKPVIARRLEESGRTLQAVSSLSAGGPARRCTRAIGRARRAIIARMLRRGIACQNAIDGGAAILGEVAGSCVANSSKLTTRWRGRIAAACAGVSSADVGTCDPLPDCVTTSVLATGQDLLHDVYGGSREDLCGNGEIDAGEQCDDGNRVDGDACTNQCTTAFCGDGVVEAGVEQCDDGNQDETDTCTPRCELARCGDGIVERGVEDCDDGPTNGTAGDLCQADCTFPRIACSASGRIAVTATLVPKRDHSTYPNPKGLTAALTYPSGPSGVSIPGSGNLNIDDPNDPTAHIVLLDLDLYNGLIAYNDSDTVLKTVVAPQSTIPLADALPFERVSFECASAALFNAGQFQCEVIDEADALGALDTSARPDCTITLGAAP
jgi:cysteine-rich repeat protein